MTADRQRDLARAASDWSWEADEALRLTRVCDRFTGATGRPASTVLGQGLDTLGSLSEELIAAVAQREVLRGAPLVVDAGDRSKSFRLSGLPRFDGGGGFIGYAGTAVQGDTSPQPEGRAAFLSNVGHEFRTPLNAIIGFAEVMNGELYGPLSDRYAGYARDIAQAGRHLLALIQDVLDAAANEDEADITLRVVEIDTVIDSCLRIAAITADARRVSIVREDSGVSYSVRADERRVAQILVNLLVNAIKFSPEGERVGIAARRAGDTVQIEIADNGPGIAPEDQSRIFGKFEQVQSPATTREGVGLGLAIAHDFAVAMDGRLEVASALGEGARFTLTLPSAS